MLINLSCGGSSKLIRMENNYNEPIRIKKKKSDFNSFFDKYSKQLKSLEETKEVIRNDYKQKDFSNENFIYNQRLLRGESHS